MALLAALLGTSCFDPDIPCGAFYCDPERPRCPAGQTCDRGVCVCPAAPPDGLSPRTDATLPPDGKPEKGPVHLDASVPQDAGDCDDAALEPNNSSATATALPDNPGSVSGKEICYPGDVDHMRFRVPAGSRLRVTVNFMHADGDLDVVLLNPNGQTIDESKGFSDSEVVEMAAATASTGNYTIGVVGYGDAVNIYSLEIALK